MMANAIGAPKPLLEDGLTNFASTALAIAMVAPTDRSTPPVPMTRAMPSDTMMTGGSWANSSVNGRDSEEVRGGEATL